MAKAEHKKGYCMCAGVFAKRTEMLGKSKSVDPDGIYESHYYNKNYGVFLDARARVPEALVRSAASVTLELMAKTQANFDPGAGA